MNRFRIWHRTAAFHDLSAIQPEPLARLHDIWRAAAAEGLPRQRDLPMESLRDLLPNIALLDLSGMPPRACYRLMGPALRDLLGRDPSGLFLEEVYPLDVHTEIYKAIDNLVASREPSFYQREFRILNQSFGYRRLLLPLRLNGAEVSSVLVGIYPTKPALKRAAQWQKAVDALHARNKAVDAAEAAWNQSLPEPGAAGPDGAGARNDIWLV